MRDKRGLVEAMPMRTYGVYAPDEVDVEADFFALGRQTPASISLYRPMAQGYELFYTRPGYDNLQGFRPLAAVHTRSGFQVVSSTEATFARDTAGEEHPASSASTRAPPAPARLPLHTPLVGRGLRWESLFAAYLDCSVAFHELFCSARLPRTGHSLDAYRACAKFVQRQDLIYLHRFDGSAGARTTGALLWADALVLQARAQHLTLPSTGPLLAHQDVQKLSAVAQLGLLRTVTSAHLAMYVAVAERALLVKTHERFGGQRGRTHNFAAAATAHGWFVLPPQVAFSNGDDHRATPYLDDLHLNAAGHAYATLFDAYLLGGGVCFDVADDFDHNDQRRHVRHQTDAFIWRWRAAVRLHSAAEASAWGESFEVSVPMPFVAARTLAAQPNATPTLRGPPASPSAERDLELGLWFDLDLNALGQGRVSARATCEEHQVQHLALDVDHHGLLAKADAASTGSPRLAFRRLTWPGSPTLGASPRPSASPERSPACP